MDKILIISMFYEPEQIGIGKYTTEMAKRLVEQGMQVRVVTAFPFYPEWKRYAGYPAWRFHKEKMDGVEVIRCPLYVPARVNALTRLLHLVSFGLTSSLAILAQIVWGPDYVFSVMPTITNWPAAILTARLCGSQSWLHVQDFEFDLALSLRILPNRRYLIWLMQKIDHWLYHSFDVVSTISHCMVKRLVEEKHLAGSRTYFFPNWVDTQEIKPQPGPNWYRQQLGIDDDQIVVLYSGNMGRKYGLEVLGGVSRQLARNDEFVFVFAGDGVARLELESVCADLTNVYFLPVQPVERLNDLLNAADIHVLPQRATAADYMMPSKLLGMLASGKPVVATAPANSEIGVLTRGCSVLVEPENAAALTEAIVALGRSPTRRQELGRLGRQLVETMYAKEQVLAHFHQRLTASLN